MAANQTRARHNDEEKIIHDADEAAHYSMQQNKKDTGKPRFSTTDSSETQC
jgi:hypothetical protein